jgi:methylated-DNA-protein-cysteine methyltransferase-like protein
MHSTYSRIYSVVARIPAGWVATYGQVARLAGLPGQARQVGYALSACDGALPWQRVVNAQGRVSQRRDGHGDEVQRMLLESEGVRFDAGGRIPLERYLWQP